jgi:hypothetical protein
MFFMSFECKTICQYIYIFSLQKIIFSYFCKGITYKKRLVLMGSI